MADRTVHHFDMDVANWPVAMSSVLVLSWSDLWERMPGPTTVYAVVTSAFMLFQMADKLGLLERFKKRTIQEVPDEPPTGK